MMNCYPAWRKAVPLVVCVLAVMVMGCHSTGKSTKSAGVEIQGNTPGQINDVAAEVFREKGYKVSQPQPTRLVAEKPGSRMNNFAYGDWMGDPVWVRVEVSIVPVAQATWRLECKVFMVRDRGAATEEQVGLKPFQARSYQKLLEEVAARFHRPASST